ncbi:hypothetical protein GCM10009551_082410 [Nocardiopsis tropica]
MEPTTASSGAPVGRAPGRAAGGADRGTGPRLSEGTRERERAVLAEEWTVRGVVYSAGQQTLRSTMSPALRQEKARRT